LYIDHILLQFDINPASAHPSGHGGLSGHHRITTTLAPTRTRL